MKKLINLMAATALVSAAAVPAVAQDAADPFLSTQNSGEELTPAQQALLLGVPLVALIALINDGNSSSTTTTTTTGGGS